MFDNFEIYCSTRANLTRKDFNLIRDDCVEKHVTDPRHKAYMKILVARSQIANQNRVYASIRMREIKTFDNYNYWLCDGEDPEGNIFQLKQKIQ